MGEVPLQALPARYPCKLLFLWARYPCKLLFCGRGTPVSPFSHGRGTPFLWARYPFECFKEYHTKLQPVSQYEKQAKQAILGVIFM